jgi:ankyrin repeat protein
MASQHGHTRVVDVLLRHRADPNLAIHDGFTALYMASQHGHTRVVDVLLRHGADPNLPKTVEPYSVPLEIAATNGHAETVERLLEGGQILIYHLQLNPARFL